MWNYCENIVSVALILVKWKFEYLLAQLIPLSPLKPVVHLPKDFFFLFFNPI